MFPRSISKPEAGISLYHASLPRQRREGGPRQGQMEVFSHCRACCGKLKFTGNAFKCNSVSHVGVREGGKGTCISMISLKKLGIILSANYTHLLTNKPLVSDKSQDGFYQSGRGKMSIAPFVFLQCFSLVVKQLQ